MSAGYAALVALAEREWSLVAAGQWEQLPALADERRAAVAGLPPPPPPHAAPPPPPPAGPQGPPSAALSAARAQSGRELSRLTAGRGAVRAYGAPAARPSDPR